MESHLLVLNWTLLLYCFAPTTQCFENDLLLALWNVTRNLLHDFSPNNRSSQPPTTQQAASGRSVLTFGLTSTHCWKWHTITSGGQRGWKSDWKPYLETKSMVKLNQIVAGSADHEWMSDHQIYDPSINNALAKNRLWTTWLVYAVSCGLQTLSEVGTKLAVYLLNYFQLKFDDILKQNCFNSFRCDVP